MVHEILKDLLIQQLGPLKRTRKGWGTRNCPLCHLRGESADKRKRFGVMFNADGKIAVNCFNCGFDAVFVPHRQFSKDFTQFMREIGISQYDIQKLNFELFKEQNKLETSTEIELRGTVTKNWVKKDLPENAMPIQFWIDNGCEDENFLKVLEYAVTRGFRKFDDLYWTPDTKLAYNKRMLLPFWYKGNIVGYTGRFYTEPPNKSIPKYLNTNPTNFIYNLDKQYDFDRKYVILCEGVFDAYFVDGISPLGNHLNDDQVSLIRSLGKIIIVCPDRDRAGEGLVKVAIENNWRVAFPEWPSGVKDAAQATTMFGRILTVKSIIDTQDTNPMSIQLKWRMNKNV